MIYFLKDLMGELDKRIADFFQSIFSLIKVLFFSKFRIKLPEKAEQNECLIIGNGPSFNSSLQENENVIKNKVLFCVNGFSNTPEFQKFKPENCVFLDPLFYVKNSKDIMPHVREIIENLVLHTKWELNVFIPTLARHSSHLTELPQRNSNIKIYYFNYTIIKGYRFLRHALFKMNLGMPSCQNVLGACTMVALNMGFKKIYLLGADHDVGRNVFVDEQNEVRMIHQHFYDKNKQPTVTSAYKRPGGEKLNIADFYMLCAKTFQAYYLIEDYARYLNRNIYNATENSFIDAFERKKINLD